MKILILNGPNLNLLGTRETDIYGKQTLKSIEKQCEKHAKTLKINVEMKQSNHEGELIEWIHAAKSKFDGIIINAAAYTHTSVAILDAFKAVDIPYIEVHMSNVHARESFRQHSFLSQNARGIICGFGPDVYTLALSAFAK